MPRKFAQRLHNVMRLLSISNIWALAKNNCSRDPIYSTDQAPPMTEAAKMPKYKANQTL